VLEGGEGGLGGVVVAEDAETRGPGRRGESVTQAEPFAGLGARVAGDNGARDGRQDFRLGALGPLVVGGAAAVQRCLPGCSTTGNGSPPPLSESRPANSPGREPGFDYGPVSRSCGQA
jgi:hypothetical protein